MTTPRFLVSTALRRDDRIALTPEASHHALRVLRLRAGAPLLVFDGSGLEADATLEVDAVDGAHARVGEVRVVDREAKVSITLLQALCAQDKTEWLVEKSVELGVARIVLFPAQRSVVRLDDSRRTRREERLREIATAATHQCGRTRVASVEIASDLGASLAGHAGARWILDPHADSGFAGDGSVRTSAGFAAVFAVGPEGGFTTAEVALAQECGFARLRLGPRVLRTETAGLVAVAALLALQGEFA